MYQYTTKEGQKSIRKEEFVEIYRMLEPKPMYGHDMELSPLNVTVVLIHPPKVNGETATVEYTLKMTQEAKVKVGKEMKKIETPMRIGRCRALVVKEAGEWKLPMSYEETRQIWHLPLGVDFPSYQANPYGQLAVGGLGGPSGPGGLGSWGGGLGAPVTWTKYCSSCKKLLQSDWKFCPYCGKPAATLSRPSSGGK